MNSVVLIGRLTKDPEIKYISDNQMAVANFTVAVDRPMAKEKTADFIRVVVFGKQAENCGTYLAKGRMVGVQGRIQTSSYKGKDGETRYTTDVVADRVEFIDWGDRQQRTGSGMGASSFDSPKPMPAGIPEGFQALDDDDDIPF